MLGKSFNMILLHIVDRLKKEKCIEAMKLTTSAGTHDVSSYSDCKQQQIVPAHIKTQIYRN